MEGIEQNPVVYDLMSEMAFQHENIDVKVIYLVSFLIPKLWFVFPLWCSREFDPMAIQGLEFFYSLFIDAIGISHWPSWAALSDVYYLTREQMAYQINLGLQILVLHRLLSVHSCLTKIWEKTTLYNSSFGSILSTSCNFMYMQSSSCTETVCVEFLCSVEHFQLLLIIESIVCFEHWLSLAF